MKQHSTFTFINLAMFIMELLERQGLSPELLTTESEWMTKGVHIRTKYTHNTMDVSISQSDDLYKDKVEIYIVSNVSLSTNVTIITHIDTEKPFQVIDFTNTLTNLLALTR